MNAMYVKLGIHMVLSVCVNAVVTEALKQVLPEVVHPVTKVVMTIGVAAVSATVAEAAINSFDRAVEPLVEDWGNY